MTGQLLVMAKHPAPGRVKTRLCPPCTPHQAAVLAAAALADTLDAVRQAPAERRVLAIDPPTFIAPGFDVLSQRGGGLGDRIAHAFGDTAATCRGPILQLGMDTPQVDGALLADCLHRLSHDDVDAVVGPAVDGGWWALGLRDAHHASVLRTVPMSTPQTGRDTVDALRAAGLRVGMLPLRRDIDTFDDVLAVARITPRSRFAAAADDLRSSLAESGRA